MTDIPSERPTNRETDIRVHREVSLPKLPKSDNVSYSGAKCPTDRPTDTPTDRQKDMKVHREV